MCAFSSNTSAATDEFVAKVIPLILQHEKVDAIYLYGSRAKGIEREDSDWDFGVLFSEFIEDKLERVSRPQTLEAFLERELKSYGCISVADVESVPTALQYNIVSGKKLYDRAVPHVRHVEHGIYSKIEEDDADRKRHPI